MDIESPNEHSNNHQTAQQPQPTGRKIPKVPYLLRQEDLAAAVAYDPKVVSLGPYHHGKLELQTGEQMKHLALKVFVQGSNQTPQFYYAKVLEVISDARNCYVDGSTDIYSDEQFAGMMLLDSCFLIYYIYLCTNPINHPYFVYIYSHFGGLVHSFVNRDVFLMENQIPFQILMLLINLRYDDGEEAVSKFLHQTIWGKYEHQRVQDIKQQQKQSQPLHLFEAFRRVLVWDMIPQSRLPGMQVQTAEQGDIDLKKQHKTFRSAKDLKAKGIHFMPSPNKSLKAINFYSFSFYGQLQLPTWFVSNISNVFFLNMIAYELCPNNLVDTTVISYVNFMKSLIDSPADVKELREKRILLTSLGSDEDVVKLYRDLNTYGMTSTLSYMGVKQRIQEHYDSRAKTWMAQLIHTYFSSPWSAIAWFAAVFLLVLTVVQTYFTVNPRE